MLRLTTTPLLLVGVTLGACQPQTNAVRITPSASAPQPDLGCDPTSAPPREPFERSPGGVPEVTADWVARHHCQLRVVDVREATELGDTLLPFAEHVPLDRVADEAAAWDPAEPIVFVCRSGRRSARATRLLEDMGYARVASMTGGFLMWAATGHPVDHGPTFGRAEPSTRGDEPHDGPLDQAEIEAHLGDPRQVRWVKAAALLMQGTESCVDGRDRRPVVGTPGGDAGELLLALAALEATRGQPIDAAEVTRLLDAYLTAFGRFYMHTDERALEFLRDDPRFAEAIADRGIDGVLRHPPRALEPLLLEELTRPDHVGCGHLRLVLSHPQQYAVRPELTRALLRAVLRRLWQGAAIDLVILEGEHHEGAVVEIRLDREIHAFTRIPTFAPRLDDRELFISHPEVSAWLRSVNAAFLFEVDPWLREHPEARGELLRRLDEMAASQLEATLGHLAQSLPVYVAHVSEDAVRVQSVR